MPLYEYQCQKCSDEFELLIRSGSDTAECPRCHSGEVRRRISVPAAPTVSGRALPMSSAAPAELCGRQQCNAGG